MSQQHAAASSALCRQHVLIRRYFRAFIGTIQHVETMMDIERQRTLKSRHPDILEKVGIECGNGWWDLIDVLCHQIEEQAEHEGLASPRALQIKQKFGGLRFYTDRSNDLYFALTKMAEAMSFRICEDCGHPGALRPGSGVFTLCQDCFDQFQHNDPMWHKIDD